ncbi:hypothetical protein CHS0354_001075 [Potamilus streckersoni]|uniref:GSKIP domain-containing protein n=1 Tax=Potamilus streckersoni TaxID=2493646 RepID=A0AAE0RVX0_9BIVA|nr:hypothetical protein CHS0354_001075 [Potamilus streckersoni]
MDDEDNYSLKIEANEIVKEVSYSVNEVKVSEKLPKTKELVYLNICTKENVKLCVELSLQGYRVVSRNYDIIEEKMSESRFFETIYALLDTLSPGYRNTFSEALMMKLQGLQQQRAQKGEEST